MFLLPSKLLPASFKDWIRRIIYGPVLADDMAQAQCDVMDAQARVYRKGMELLRETKDARASEYNVERELTQLFADALKETSQLGRTLNGGMAEEERRDILDRPFVGLKNGTPSLPAGSGHGTQNHELKTSSQDNNQNGHVTIVNNGHDEPVENQTPVRRARGRPKGSTRSKYLPKIEPKTEEPNS